MADFIEAKEMAAEILDRASRQKQMPPIKRVEIYDAVQIEPLAQAYMDLLEWRDNMPTPIELEKDT